MGGLIDQLEGKYREEELELVEQELRKIFYDPRD